MDSGEPRLLIVADDFGLNPSYDAGIIEAAAAGALDGVGAMVLRVHDPVPVRATGVAIGLHLELGHALDAATVEAELRGQLERFESLFAAPPAYIDGHHHCHADSPASKPVAELARERGLAVRSVDDRHRGELHAAGVRTPDRLIGRLDEVEPVESLELEALLGGDGPPGFSEWMVHPGYADSSSGSGYDAGREQDLALLLSLAAEPALRRLRATHAELPDPLDARFEP
ncbi:MAG: ChbG/HpnK family deacetylase [Solirubrobacterales bacterium]|nr:ChbG/HpnK family deacetylase [Solirubrobacterales bacterium]